MNTVSRIISGTAALVLGAFVLYAAITEGSDTWSLVWGVIWGIFICGIGVYLCFNKKEDEIEEIKNEKQ